MPLKKKSFLDRLTGWWRGAPPRPRGRMMSREDCEADPESALAELQEEQALIAQELEDTFLSYDKKLQAAARRLSGLDNEPMTEKELAKLREEQLELWRLVRRSQAASRTTRELKRELKEWSGREPGVAPFGHPDHPGTRAELVASELRVRGVGAMPCVAPPSDDGLRGKPFGGVYPERNRGTQGRLQAEGVEVGERAAVSGEPFGGVYPERNRGTQGRLQAESGSETAIRLPLTEIPVSPGPAWEHDDDEALLRELRSRRGEMERLLKNDADPASRERLGELAAFLSELRELHAHLRLHDRRNGISRERWRMGMPGQVSR